MSKPRLLLTGASGMVGKNFLACSLSKNWDILSPSSKELNLMDYDKLEKYLLNKKPDYVIHAAGLVGGISANINNSLNFLNINSRIGHNMIMASYNSKIKNFLNIGSTCMYPRNIEAPLEEKMILSGQLEPTNEGYALAKILTTKLCQYISDENKQYNYKTIIPCNLYGKFDKFDPIFSHLLPAVIVKVHNACINNLSKIDIWGDGQARREFMYVGDFIDALYKAIDDIDLLPNIMNCGVGSDYSINDYYKMVTSVIGWQGRFEHDLSKPVGMMKKLSSIELQKKWGWYPKTSIENGIKSTYEYFLSILK